MAAMDVAAQTGIAPRPGRGCPARDHSRISSQNYPDNSLRCRAVCAFTLNAKSPEGTEPTAYQCPHGSRAVTAIAANSSVRYAIDR